jgi:nucleotide-binding universal stress UspA family protein
LAVPETISTLDQALLAYDGSAKAKEALFLAAYLAAQWQTQLVVVTVKEEQHSLDTALQRAQNYLQTQGLEATYVSTGGPVARAILATASEHNSDLIIMGGYGRSPVLEVVLGSAVDEVLRTSEHPVLICR